MYFNDFPCFESKDPWTPSKCKSPFGGMPTSSPAKGAKGQPWHLKAIIHVVAQGLFFFDKDTIQEGRNIPGQCPSRACKSEMTKSSCVVLCFPPFFCYLCVCVERGVSLVVFVFSTGHDAGPKLGFVIRLSLLGTQCDPRQDMNLSQLGF